MEFLKNFQAGASVPMCPSRDIVRQSFSSMILSASGFRKIFSSDGIEESASPAVTAADAALTAFIGRAFAEFCRRRTGKTSLTIALGTDTRPTGASLADLLIRIFSADGINVRYSGATAVPELTAWVKTDADIDAFVYVSASHNPIGHNGFKFGFEDGAVMEPEAAAVFIEEVRSGVKRRLFLSKKSAAASKNSNRCGKLPKMRRLLRPKRQPPFSTAGSRTKRPLSTLICGLRKQYCRVNRKSKNRRRFLPVLRTKSKPNGWAWSSILTAVRGRSPLMVIFSPPSESN